ncbi:MAG: PEP-CTERM sorting domain-containing protein [Planctomycetia bacterium]|nr:PEP-CTERM sorting domain-containing protein [Planctomycetia bacterium]
MAGFSLHVEAAESSSMFSGMGALFNLNTESDSLKLDATNQVVSWDDALGSGFSFTPVILSTSTNPQAVLGSMTVGGSSYDAVDLTNIYLAGSGSLAIKSVFIVNEMDSTAQWRSIFGLTGGARKLRWVDNAYWGYRNAGADLCEYGYMAANGNTDFQIYKRTGNTPSFYLNVSPTDPNIIAIQTQSTQSSFTPSLGDSSLNSNIALFNGVIAEVVAFDFTLSASEIKIVQTMLSATYNLPSSMETGSVYELNPNYTSNLFWLGRTVDDTSTVVGNAHQWDDDGNIVQKSTLTDTADKYFDVTSNSRAGFGLEFSRESGATDIFDTTQGEISLFVASSEDGSAWNIHKEGTLAYINEADTLVSLYLDYDLLGLGTNTDEYNLLFRSSESDEWEILKNYVARTAGAEGLTFTFAASDFALGMYSVGLPEPSSIGLLLLGVGLLLARRKVYRG